MDASDNDTERHMMESWAEQKFLVCRVRGWVSRQLGVVVGIGLCGAFTSTDVSGQTALGPLVEEFPLTLKEGRRMEILGPLFHRESSGTEAGWGVAPLIFWRKDSSLDFSEGDLLYPAITYDRFGAEFRFQILQLLNFTGGSNQEDETTRRFSLFPFYFHQRSADPGRNYTALFPIYGRLLNRFQRDRSEFALFPLYAKTWKRDVVTWNYLYPIFHLRRGNELRGWQVWPLAGHETKGITQVTNQFEDLEIVGGHEKRFYAWPLYLSQKSGIGTTNEVRQQALLPLYSRFRSPARDSTTYLWPFGLTVTDDRQRKYREIGAPWPLVTFARGEGKTANRIWPLFGEARNATLSSRFYLWPIYKFNSAKSDPLDRRRMRLLFFLYSDLTEKNTATGTALRRTDLWPLFTARKDHDGNDRFQALSFLEPLLPNNKSIERNYSPLWSVWRSERNSKTGAASQSLLWNLYRRDVRGNSKKCSLLFGLFHYQSGPDGRRWRVFYVPLGKRASDGGKR